MKNRWLLTYEVEVDAETEDEAVNKARRILQGNPPEPILIEEPEEDDE